MSSVLYISWKEEFSVGLRVLDNQHQTLFYLINQLYESMRSDKSQKTASTVIQELNKYAIAHFKEEENVMKAFNFPKLTLHQETHRWFAQEAEKFGREDRSFHSDSSYDILKFLKEWLINHILRMDMQYKPFINPGNV